MVKEIEANLERNKNLTVKTLFDYSRGLRNKENSKTIFNKCIVSYPDRFQLFLYHTPKLRGILKRLLPDRVNEIIGVMHIKVYIADNDLLITGANLSNDYFVNRQDRYILLKDCKNLCDFYCLLFDSVRDFSFKVDKNGEINFFNDNKSLHPYQGIYTEFCNEFANKIDVIYEKYRSDLSCVDLNVEKFEALENDNGKAYVVPLVQNGLANVRIDETFTKCFITNAAPGSLLNLATGYFNLTDDLIERILKSKAQHEILTTSALANGFYGSKGFSKYIPDIYTCIEQNFYEKVLKQKMTDRVKLYEYFKESWTFHAKGLWYTSDKGRNSMPTLTVIGSSNFGYRSVDRDLEFQLAIYSHNEKFKRSLMNEQVHLYENSKRVSEKILLNRLTIWIKIGTKFLKSYF